MLTAKFFAICFFLVFVSKFGAEAQYATPNPLRPEPSEEELVSAEWIEPEENPIFASKVLTNPIRRFASAPALDWFFAQGSGSGPISSETDGGLAWEDAGPGAEYGPIVLITRTKVLYKTVQSTIFPVELTPTVVYPPGASTIATPPLVTPSPPSGPDASSPIPISPTLSFPPEGTLHISEIFPGRPENQDQILMNQLYWVQTIIRANATKIHSTEPVFVQEMEKNLAKVYASAFKRHLMHALGILRKKANLQESPESQDQNQELRNDTAPKPSFLRRRRRSWRMEDLEDAIGEETTANFFYLANLNSGQLSPSQMQSLATAVLNVTVQILNISQTDGSKPWVTISYVVCAEGNPVLASSAVHDLEAQVKKQEMETQIGYEVIKKAEALVATPLIHEEQRTEIATSPWLIVAIVSIVIMACLVLVICVMVWKWKSNRLGDTSGLHSAPPTSRSGIEGGVVNPAFLGPTRLSGSSAAQVPRSGSLHNVAKPTVEKHVAKPSTATATALQTIQQQHLLASELNRLIKNKPPQQQRPLSSTASISSGSDGSTSRLSPSQQENLDPQRHSSARYRTNSSNVRRTNSPKRKPRRKDADQQQQPQQHRPDEFGFPNSFEIPQVTDLDTHLSQSGKSVDRISYDDLEICQEPIARPLSSKARKLLPPRAGSARGSRELDSGSRVSLRDVPEEGAMETGGTLTKDKDREITESMEHIPVVASTSDEPRMKDAQVQTPTRRPKPRSKPRREQMSTESLISTESEELFEVHNFDQQVSDDQNPMGRMRKRFHQFLDDAFNVMNKKDEVEEGHPQSAKIWVSRSVETREVPTGPASIMSSSSAESSMIRNPELVHPIQSVPENFRSPSAAGGESSSPRFFPPSEIPSIVEPVFPSYPIYPDIPMTVPSRSPGQSPAVPLIMAIKEEIKRFEKIKTTKSSSSSTTTTSTSARRHQAPPPDPDPPFRSDH